MILPPFSLPEHLVSVLLGKVLHAVPFTSNSPSLLQHDEEGVHGLVHVGLLNLASQPCQDSQVFFGFHASHAKSALA